MPNFIYRVVKDVNEIELLEKWFSQNPEINVDVWNAAETFLGSEPPEYGMTQENWERFDHEKHKFLPTIQS